MKGIQLSMAWDGLADLDSDAEFTTINLQPPRSHPLLTVLMPLIGPKP